MYNLFGLHNVSCMYNFKAAYLVLDSHMVCCSLKKCICWALSIVYLSVVLCVEFRPLGFALPTLVYLQLLLFRSYSGSFVG